MNRLALCVLAVVIAVSVGCYYFFRTSVVEVKPSQQVFKVKIRIENTSSDLVTKPKIYVFAPLKDTPFQRLMGVQVSTPYELQTTNDSSYIVLSPEYLAPFARKDVVITYRVEFPNVGFDSEDYWDEYSYPLLNPISYAAENFSEMLDWIDKQVSYMGYVPEVLGSEYALKHGKGDCTEFALTFSRLAASNGYNAITVDGFAVLNGSNKLKFSDYHSWSYIEDDGQVHLIDAQNNLVNLDVSKYLVMSYISEPKADKSQLKRRFYSDDERLKLTIL